MKYVGQKYYTCLINKIKKKNTNVHYLNNASFYAEIHF